jgi:hypothetical protein
MWDSNPYTNFHSERITQEWGILSELLPSHLEMGNEIGLKGFFEETLNQIAHVFQGSQHARQTESDGYQGKESDGFEQAKQVGGRGIVSLVMGTSLWGNGHLFFEETCHDLGQIDPDQTCLDIFGLCRVRENGHDNCLCLDPSKAIVLVLDHAEGMGNGMSIAFSLEMES